MPPHLNKLPELELPKNALLDFTPIERVADGWEKQRQFDEQKKLEREKLDITRQHLGIAQQKADDERKQAQIQEWGRTANVIDDMKDPMQRKAAWSQFVGQHPDFPAVFQKYGVDANDHINGPRFLRSQAGLYDPQKDAQARAQIGMANAHSNLYNTQAGYYRDKGAAERETAEATRREMEDMVVGPDGNLGIRRRSAPKKAMLPGNPNVEPSMVQPTAGPTREQRNAATVEELGPVVQPNKRPGDTDENGNAIPTESQIQRYWTSTYGQKPPSGHKYDRDGQLINMQTGAKTSEKQEKIDRSAPIFMKNLDVASTMLRDTNPIGRAIADTRLGGYVNPVTKEALEMTDHAIVQLSAMVNGARHANAQDVRLIQYFRPSALDSDEIIAFKLDQAKKFFGAYMSARATGQSDDKLTQNFQSAVYKAYEKLQAKQQAERKGRGNAPAPGSEGDTPSMGQPNPERDRLKNKYGLE